MTSGDWVYSDILKEHFMNPKNFMKDEDLNSFDGVGKVGNIKCGDEMIVAIKVDQEKGVITDCKWKTYGCASAIGSTSIMSEIVKGMTLEAAYHLSPKDVAGALGGLPENKVHCSVLGDKALRAAIDDYYIKHGMAEKAASGEEKIVCSCMNVTEGEILEAVLDGARTYEKLQEMTKIGTICGGCENEARELLEKFVKEHF